MDTASDLDTLWRPPQPDSEEEDDSIHMGDIQPWDTSIEESEEEWDKEETQLEVKWRFEAVEMNLWAKGIMQASWEEAERIRGIAEMEAQIYKSSAGNMEKIVDTKGDFLKIATSATEDAAEGRCY